MTRRTFATGSRLDERGLGLGLSSALTPDGVRSSPSFFHGFVIEPQLVARGLVTLADVTATRYVRSVPSGLRDPILTAHGDRLRAECFSACNGVYARLDLLRDGFDGGDISHGTTNVDIGSTMRSTLTRVGPAQLLHLDVGSDGLAVSQPDETVVERPVEMPDRWIRALGNTAELHRDLVPAFSIEGAAATRFVAALPNATSTRTSGWLHPLRGGVHIGPRPVAGAVHVAGLHRFGAVKRLLTHVRGLTVFGPADGAEGAAAIEFRLPRARLLLGITADPFRGHSGEGSLLTALAAPGVLEDADLVSALLAFEPRIDVDVIARGAAMTGARVRHALAVLASSGRIGWDVRDGAYFHRELPDDPDRIEADNPRLVGARRLVAAGGVAAGALPGEWIVRSPDGDGVNEYHVRWAGAEARCTCPWYRTHGAGRGPCKHVLAVRITTGRAEPGAGDEDSHEV